MPSAGASTNADADEEVEAMGVKTRAECDAELRREAVPLEDE